MYHLGIRQIITTLYNSRESSIGGTLIAGRNALDLNYYLALADSIFYFFYKFIVIIFTAAAVWFGCERNKFYYPFTPNKIILVCVILLSALFLAGTINNGHDWGSDFAGYITQAQSITTGTIKDFIIQNRFIIQNSFRTMGPVAYPWGFPLLLAPIYAVFGLNITALKSIGAVCYLLFLFTMFYGFRRTHAPFWLFVLLCIFAFNPGMISFSNQVLSDIPFLFFSTLSVILIGKTTDSRTCIISPVTDRLLTGTVIALSYTIRTNGILLTAVLLSSQLLRGACILFHRAPIVLENTRVNRRTILLQLLPYITMIVFLGIWHVLFPGGGASHLAELKQFSVPVLIKNIFYYTLLSSEFFKGIFSSAFSGQFADISACMLYGICSVLFVSGIIRRGVKEPYFILYIFYSFLMYSVWPIPQGLRFLFPILPFCASYVISGFEWVIDAGFRTKEKKILNIFVFTGLLLIIGYSAVSSGKHAYTNLSVRRSAASGPYSVCAQEMFSFITKKIACTEVIVFFKPRVMTMQTGRRAISLIQPDDHSRAGFLCWYKGNVSGQIPEEDLNRLIINKKASQVYENAEFGLYRLSF